MESHEHRSDPRMDEDPAETLRTGPTAARPASVTKLFSDLMRETAALVHNEAQLIKSEMAQKVNQVGSGATSMIVAAVLGIAGLVILLQSAVLGLATVDGISMWLSALIVGGATVILALIFLASGRSRLKAEHLKPSATTTSMPRDSQLIKEHVR